ncbi:hypothetical protein Taro_042228 [Colocasia esculenta]|uniref:Uncharacterized protein n=1 Tax=Colocasia esculenta TaxID=4460 RepID=A0A843WS77_COLES|nr:hypothetical protein [Colocasia esculenta]
MQSHNRMTGARHSCPVPSDSTGSSSLPEKGQDDRVSTLDQVVSTPCSKHKTKSCKTGQVVSTLVQVVSTQCIKYKAKRSSSVDTSPGSVDTRASSQNTFWPSWDSMSTLAHVVSTLEAFPEPLLGWFGTVCRH